MSSIIAQRNIIYPSLRPKHIFPPLTKTRFIIQTGHGPNGGEYVRHPVLISRAARCIFEPGALDRFGCMTEPEPITVGINQWNDPNSGPGRPHKWPDITGSNSDLDAPTDLALGNKCVPIMLLASAIKFIDDATTIYPQIESDWHLALASQNDGFEGTYDCFVRDLQGRLALLQFRQVPSSMLREHFGCNPKACHEEGIAYYFVSIVDLGLHKAGADYITSADYEITRHMRAEAKFPTAETTQWALTGELLPSHN